MEVRTPPPYSNLTAADPSSQASGVEGTFKITAQNTMRVLRDNKESIIAVLEAFVHDPLINWRLVQGGRQVEGRAGNGENAPAARRPRGDETNIFDGPWYSLVTSFVGSALIVLLDFRRGRRRSDQHEGAPGRRARPAEAHRYVSSFQRICAPAESSSLHTSLPGRDFKPTIVLNVTDQVAKLIEQASSLENLSQCFIGWCVSIPHPSAAKRLLMFVVPPGVRSVSFRQTCWLPRW